jgi:hypothetical protein
VPPDAGLQQRANFSSLIVGLDGTGDRTWATCEAGSNTNRSAIHYDIRYDTSRYTKQSIMVLYLATIFTAAGGPDRGGGAAPLSAVPVGFTGSLNPELEDCRRVLTTSRGHVITAPVVPAALKQQSKVSKAKLVVF